MKHTSVKHRWQSLSQPEREREYSPSSCIGGDYRPFVEAYARESAESRNLAVVMGGHWDELRYGKAPAQRMSLCLPADAANRLVPLLVFIHGGYWQELSAEESLFPAANCIKHGMAYAAIDYTLAPGASVADIVDECRAAMVCLAQSAEPLGIDPSRIAVAGSSAGAHLASMVCLPGWRRTTGSAFRPAGAILASGIYELEPLIGTSINTALSLNAYEAQRQSPALFPATELVGFPKTIVCWGDIETMAFKYQSRCFAASLRLAGTICQTLEISKRNHFDVILDLASPETVLGQCALELLEKS